jgi:hypothetical protein
VLAETSVGSGLIWGTAIDGELNLLEEGIHRIDVILSVAPFLILRKWFQRSGLCDQSFRQATRNVYQVIEASFRTHRQLSTNISKEIGKWDAGFLRKLTKSDEVAEQLIWNDRTRYLETSCKLLEIYKTIEKGYVGPSISPSSKSRHLHTSSYDILQHNILSIIVSTLINSGKPRKAVDCLAQIREPFKYKSLTALAQILSQKLETAGYHSLDGGNLHVRILCSYYAIAQAILTNKIEIIIETMQELLGWLTASGFHNVFQINEDKNYTEFQSYYKTFYRNKPSLSDCLVDETVYELGKSLPKERIPIKNMEGFSECSSSIGRALTEFFVKLENTANTVEPKCSLCKETFKKIRKFGPSKPVTNSESLMCKAGNLYGDWVSNEIQRKSTALLEELRNVGLLGAYRSKQQ